MLIFVWPSSSQMLVLLPCFIRAVYTGVASSTCLLPRLSLLILFLPNFFQSTTSQPAIYYATEMIHHLETYLPIIKDNNLIILIRTLIWLWLLTGLILMQSNNNLQDQGNCLSSMSKWMISTSGKLKLTCVRRRFASQLSEPLASLVFVFMWGIQTLLRKQSAFVLSVRRLATNPVADTR